MAKGNNQKKSNDFFSQMRQKYGQNFMEFVQPNDVLNRGVSIFRDLAKGKINIEENAFCFTVPAFMQTLMTVANSKYTLHTISYMGVNMLANSGGGGDASVNIVLNFHSRASQAYKIIVDSLGCIMMAQNMEAVVSILIAMSNNLKNYRNDI